MGNTSSISSSPLPVALYSRCPSLSSVQPERKPVLSRNIKDKRPRKVRLRRLKVTEMLDEICFTIMTSEPLSLIVSPRYLSTFWISSHWSVSRGSFNLHCKRSFHTLTFDLVHETDLYIRRLVAGAFKKSNLSFAYSRSCI